MANSFEDLDVWKAGCRLAVSVTKELNDCRIFALRDQMIRAAISIPSNIAEGSERRTAKDFRYFVHVASNNWGRSKIKFNSEKLNEHSIARFKYKIEKAMNHWDRYQDYISTY